MKCCCPISPCPNTQSLPVRGAWIEIVSVHILGGQDESLPVRGAWIEIASIASPCPNRPSLPVRGAWIEMGAVGSFAGAFGSLPVRGAWIEIGWAAAVHPDRRRRSPCGERGLKCKKHFLLVEREVCRSPCGERGLKLTSYWETLKETESLPVRGAWIEIRFRDGSHLSAWGRSPCGERGLKCLVKTGILRQHIVAPRAGSVD